MASIPFRQAPTCYGSPPRGLSGPDPGRGAANPAAHPGGVGVALANRGLVDTNRLGTRCSRLGQLRLNVLLLQRLDRVPVEMKLFGKILDRGRAATPTHVMRKALGIERVVGQEIEPLAFHFSAALALNTPDLELQVDPPVTARQISCSARTPIVPAGVDTAAAAAGRFFERRTRSMTQAFGSPKTPRTMGCGRKPGNAYASVRRRFCRDKDDIQTGCPFRAPRVMPKRQYPCGSKPAADPQLTHTTS